MFQVYVSLVEANSGKIKDKRYVFRANLLYSFVYKFIYYLLITSYIPIDWIDFSNKHIGLSFSKTLVSVIPILVVAEKCYVTITVFLKMQQIFSGSK